MEFYNLDWWVEEGKDYALVNVSQSCNAISLYHMVMKMHYMLKKPQGGPNVVTRYYQFGVIYVIYNINPSFAAEQCLGRLSGTFAQDHRVSNINWLHVDILCFFFIKYKNIT